MNIKQDLISTILFLSAYLATYQIRHKYFNSPVFLISMVACVILFIFLFDSKNGKKIKVVFFGALGGYSASIVAYFISWIAEGGDVANYVSNFGASSLLSDLLTFPFFSYAAVILPLSLLVSKALTRRRDRLL